MGSIPELPARSCHEIKASEGKDTVSNKYWLDPSGTGKGILVYCDIHLEGKLLNLHSEGKFFLYKKVIYIYSVGGWECNEFGDNHEEFGAN